MTTTTTTTNTVTVPTTESIRDVILNRLLGSPGLAGADTATGGFFWRLAQAFAAQGRSLLVRAAQVWRDCIPTLAKGAPLVAWADTVLGDGAAAATAWSGLIRVRCVNNTQTIPPNTQLGTTEDGTRYLVASGGIAATDWVWGGTYYYCDKASNAVTLGEVGNKTATSVVTLASPPVGIYDTAYIGTTTTLGADAESEEELQARIAQHLADMPGGGSCAEFRAWCQEVPGVYDAMIYPRWDGVGALGNNSVRCVILGPPGARILTATEIAATQAHLLDRGPLFCPTPFDVVLPVATAQKVALNIKCDSGYESDYDDTAYLPVVASVDAGLRKINLSVDPTTHLIVGNRVVLHCTDFKSYQMVVQSVHIGYIIVEDVWASDPLAGKNMTAGGPLWASVRAAVEAVYDALGTSASITAGKDRWPNNWYEFPSTLYRSDLFAAVSVIPGVISATMAAPATDLASTAAENTAPHLIELIGDAADPDILIQWSHAT